MRAQITAQKMAEFQAPYLLQHGTFLRITQKHTKSLGTKITKVV
jgi:hypothetical protein